MVALGFVSLSGWGLYRGRVNKTEVVVIHYQCEKHKTEMVVIHYQYEKHKTEMVVIQELVS